MNKPLLHNLTKVSFSLTLLFCAPIVYALSTDKNQDIEIESNTVYLDDAKNLGIYNGNVVIIQGSIRITGDKLTVFYTDENELEKIIVEGEPATFRQLPDGSSVYDEAEALIMEYRENSNLIILTNKAEVKQDERRLIAEYIEYDTELSRVRATGNQPDANTSEDSRVRLIIPGKKQSDDHAD